MSEEIKGFDINSAGYGMIPKSVMQNKELSINAKAVYAYFCSYTGAGNSCFPSRSKICYDLGISNNSLTKYVRELTNQGYITIKQVKEKGRFSHNVYTLPDVKIPYTKICDTENLGHGKLTTKNNSIKNNSSFKNNNSFKKEREKAKKSSSYDEILSSIENEHLKETYYEYIKMRKLIKSPLTDRALKILIKKVEALEPVRVDKQVMILETAIANNWKSVYPLRQDVDIPPKRSRYQDDIEKLNAIYRQ